MKKVLFLGFGLIVVLTGMLAVDRSAAQDAVPPTATAGSGKAVARFYLFYSQTCPHCHEVMENFLPPLYARYGDQVESRYFDIYNNPENYLTMLGLERKLGVPDEQQGYVPTLVIGDRVLIGSDEIQARLETYIDQSLAQGGIDFPSLEDLPTVVVPTPEPAVQVLVAFDRNHADFQPVNALIVSLSQKYGNRFQAFALDLSQQEQAGTLAQINAALGIKAPPQGTPQVLIDRQMLVGRTEIEARLPGLVEKYLAEGGKALPSLEELTAAPVTPTPTRPPIYLAYFEKAGCQECARTTYDLQVVGAQFPQVVVDRFPIEEQDNILLNECLSERYGVPEEKRLSTPMIFVGRDVLIGTEANVTNLLAVVGRYAATGAERTWQDCQAEQARQSLVARLTGWKVLTVLGAGLIDGLNPCAFATLVFFISYMAFTGRRGRDILMVGIAFALGVFLTYLLVGVGLLRAIQSLSFFTALGRWVYLLTALLCMVLAALTGRDFFKARQGQVSEMTLKLPMGLRRRIHQVIRDSAQVRAFVAMALITGFVVSLIELACTGQVYLPTIVYVLSVPELAARAFFYLLLYCLMFILPLVVVFGLSYLGTTSEQLGQFVNRHTATIKLATGLVFLGLALWMTWTLAPLFGVHSPGTWGLMAGVPLVVAAGVVLLLIRDRRAPARLMAGGRTAQRRRRRA